MTEYDRARDAMKRLLAAAGMNASDLAREAKVDLGTVLDFLNGVRVPQLKTRGRLEAAVGWPPGTLEDVARGSEPPAFSEAVVTEENSRPEGEIDRRSVTELIEAGEAPLLSIDPEALRGLSEEQQAIVIREAQEHALRTARLLRGER